MWRRDSQPNHRSNPLRRRLRCCCRHPRIDPSTRPSRRAARCSLPPMSVSACASSVSSFRAISASRRRCRAAPKQSSQIAGSLHARPWSFLFDALPAFSSKLESSRCAFHDCRSTFCTWARRAGKTDSWISERTDHDVTGKRIARYDRGEKVCKRACRSRGAWAVDVTDARFVRSDRGRGPFWWTAARSSATRLRPFFSCSSRSPMRARMVSSLLR